MDKLGKLDLQAQSELSGEEFDQRKQMTEDRIQEVRNRLVQGDWKDIFKGLFTLRDSSFSVTDYPWWILPSETAEQRKTDEVAEQLRELDGEQRNVAFQRDVLALRHDQDKALQFLATEGNNAKTLRILKASRTRTAIQEGLTLVVEPWHKDFATFWGWMLQATSNPVFCTGSGLNLVWYKSAMNTSTALLIRTGVVESQMMTWTE